MNAQKNSDHRPPETSSLPFNVEELGKIQQWIHERVRQRIDLLDPKPQREIRSRLKAMLEGPGFRTKDIPLIISKTELPTPIFIVIVNAYLRKKGIQFSELVKPTHIELDELEAFLQGRTDEAPVHTKKAISQWLKLRIVSDQDL